jgi:hypothetical protein
MVAPVSNASRTFFAEILRSNMRCTAWTRKRILESFTGIHSTSESPTKIGIARSGASKIHDILCRCEGVSPKPRSVPFIGRLLRRDPSTALDKHSLRSRCPPRNDMIPVFDSRQSRMVNRIPEIHPLQIIIQTIKPDRRRVTTFRGTCQVFLCTPIHISNCTLYKLA